MYIENTLFRQDCLAHGLVCLCNQEGSNMNQVIYYVRNETILNRIAVNQHQIDMKTYLQIKTAKQMKKQILNQIHSIITLINIQMVTMHNLITKRKFQGEL